MEGIDLSKPAWGPGSQTVDELIPKESPSEESQPERVEEASVEATADEQKVPYSRFKKFHDRALEAEREAAEWRERAESYRDREPEKPADTGDVPGYWRKLYGDSEQATEAWKVQERANQEVEERAERRALEAVENREYREFQRIQGNEEVIDENLEALSEYAGHELSDREQSAILDIVDEYTPKGDDGKYAGPTIPFEKAWDIYELQQAASKGPRNKSRDSVAALSGSSSQGEPGTEGEKERDASFNPLDWNAWKKRL